MTIVADDASLHIMRVEKKFEFNSYKRRKNQASMSDSSILGMSKYLQKI